MMNQGQAAEQQAADYLQRQGLTLVDKNVRYPFGELDLVMRDGTYWVFVEVKFRSGNQFGGALNAIGAAQVARIRRAASHYLQRRHIDAPCRFDVIAIEAGQIRWLQGAF